jgi:phage gp29-like protein
MKNNGNTIIGPREPMSRAIRGKLMDPPKSGNPLLNIIVPDVRARWYGLQNRSWTPDSVRVTLDSTSGDYLYKTFDLFDMMEDSWPRYAKNGHQVRSAVAGVKMGIEAYSEDGQDPSPAAQEKADFLSMAWDKMRGNPLVMQNGQWGTIYDMMDAYTKGGSVMEIDWVRNGQGEIVPEGTRWIKPIFYDYPRDWDAKDRLMLRPGGALSDTLEDFPANKFLISVFKTKTGTHISEVGLARRLAPWWIFSNFATEWLMNFAQLFGIPIRWATYDANNPANKSVILEALEMMGSAGYGAFPEGVELNLVEAKSSTGTIPQVYIIDHADKMADMMILGATLTSDVGSSGGNRALGEVHERVSFERVQAGAQWAAEILNDQFVPALIGLNYGNADELPWFKPEMDEKKDMKELAERDRTLLKDIGLPVKKEWFYDRHEVPMPDDGDEVIQIGQNPNPDEREAMRQEIAKQGGVPVTGDQMEEHQRMTEEVVDEAPEDVQQALAALSADERARYTNKLVIAKIYATAQARK